MVSGSGHGECHITESNIDLVIYNYSVTDATTRRQEKKQSNAPNVTENSHKKRKKERKLLGLVEFFRGQNIFSEAAVFQHLSCAVFALVPNLSG